MKKFIAFILSVAMIVSMCSAIIASAYTETTIAASMGQAIANPSVTLNISAPDYIPGEKLTVNITVNGDFSNGLYAVQGNFYKLVTN